MAHNTMRVRVHSGAIAYAPVIWQKVGEWGKVLMVPKPRNKKFLQRLEMSALPKLMDPDKIAATPLTAADRVNLHV